MRDFFVSFNLPSFRIFNRRPRRMATMRSTASPGPSYRALTLVSLTTCAQLSVPAQRARLVRWELSQKNAAPRSSICFINLELHLRDALLDSTPDGARVEPF